MPVFRLETGDEVLGVPKRFSKWFHDHRRELSDEEFVEAVSYIHKTVPNVEEFFVGQVFGGVWATDHPPLEPIYNMICVKYPRADPKTQEEESAKFLGLLVLDCLIESEEKWHVMSSDITHREFRVNRYFKSKE